jgi:hypothetical protein
MCRMTAKLRMPTYLQASTDVGGQARMEWLVALLDRVEELKARWGLDLDEPFEPGGNCSWVAPGTDGDGREVVLKVAWHHTEALHEADALAALGGEGAVEVHAFEHLAPARPGGGPNGDTTPPRCSLSGAAPGLSCANVQKLSNTSSSPACSGQSGLSTCRLTTRFVPCR